VIYIKKFVLVVLLIALLCCVIYYYKSNISKDNVSIIQIDEQLEQPTKVENSIVETSDSNLKIPEITLEGNFPYDVAEIKSAWERLFPYYYKYLGKPTNFEEKGVKIYYDENKSYKDVITDATNNSVYTGKIVGDSVLMPYEDPNNPMYFHILHELAHIFFQYNGKMINFDFGQWIWEGHSLIAEVLTRTDLYDENQDIELYDLVSNIGWEGINGVKFNNNKYNKEIVDWSSTEAVRILTEVFSYDSEYDYIKRVNEGIQRNVVNTNDHMISIEEYKKILNESSKGRTIDGLLPGDWLFFQPISNIEGRIGDYLIVSPTKGAFSYNEIPNFNIAAFNRFKDEAEDIREIGLSNQEVIIKIYDRNNNEIAKSKVVTGVDGTVLFFGQSNFKFLEGAYKIKVEAVIGSNTITSINYFVVLPSESEIFKATDNRIILFPLNSSGNDFSNVDLENIKITGVETIETVSNIIILTAKPGDNIEVEYEDYNAIISKPVGGRVLPLKIN